MEGGAFQSKALLEESRKSVFVFLHQTREETHPSYHLITREYLEEDFLHPVYFFLRPDLTEVSKENRHHHEALGPSQIRDVLVETRKEWGAGLSEADYAKHRAALAEAEARLAAGAFAEAKALFAPLAGLKARCGIRDRAAAALRFIAALAGLSAEAAPLGGEPVALLGRGDLPGALRELRRADRGEAGKALAEKVLVAIREFVRLRPLRYEMLLLTTGTYHYLRAEWESDLPPFSGLALQLSYRTDDGKTSESYGLYDRVQPFRHHRAAVSVTSRDLRLAKVANARAQLWLGDVLLHEELLRKEPADFPEDESHVKVGPDPLPPDETLGAWVKSEGREWKVGRYPGR